VGNSLKVNLRTFPFDLIRGDIRLVEESLAAQVKQFDRAPGGLYILRLRFNRKRESGPPSAVLSGGATGETGEGHVRLATILEMIHVATLVHDDIIDGAEKRRDLLTANAKWGNGISVLLGDCLFAHALMLSTDFDEKRIAGEVPNPRTTSAPARFFRRNAALTCSFRRATTFASLR